MVGNPGDEMMGENLGYYTTLPNYSTDMLVDLEEAPYQVSILSFKQDVVQSD